MGLTILDGFCALILGVFSTLVLYISTWNLVTVELYSYIPPTSHYMQNAQLMITMYTNLPIMVLFFGVIWLFILSIRKEADTHVF